MRETKLADTPEDDTVKVKITKSKRPTVLAHRVEYMDGAEEVIEFHGARRSDLNAAAMTPQAARQGGTPDAWYEEENGIRSYYRAYDAELQTQRMSTTQTQYTLRLKREQVAQVVTTNVRKFVPVEPESPPGTFEASRTTTARRKNVRPSWEIVEDPREDPSAPDDEEEAALHRQGRSSDE